MARIKESIIIGVDEAGRGCLAGPVYAGAVILNDVDTSFIRDSKMISENRREYIFEHILNNHTVGIGFATPREIKKLNILQAALLAMRRAIENLKLSVQEELNAHVLVDGNQTIKNLTLSQTAVVKGDQRVRAISAASIVAKVMRDRELRKLHNIYPEYGFMEHKGYGTPMHKKAIAQYGPCTFHRETFAGVREYWSRLREEKPADL